MDKIIFIFILLTFAVGAAVYFYHPNIVGVISSSPDTISSIRHSVSCGTMHFPSEEDPPSAKMRNSENEDKTVSQGGILLIQVENTGNINGLRIVSDDSELPLFTLSDYPEMKFAILGVDVNEPPGRRKIRLLRGEKELQSETVEIVRRDFPVTKLVLSEKQKDKGYSPQKAVEETMKDTGTLREILKEPLPGIYFSDYFSPPLKELNVVGAFGNIRSAGGSAIRHLGVDLRAERGDEVRAVNRGVVRFASYLDSYGNTIVIDHGASIFSLYLHLDKIKVSSVIPGSIRNPIVEKGDVIGTVGNTGAYSLDPHLHLSIKIGGASVDPLIFLDKLRAGE